MARQVSVLSQTHTRLPKVRPQERSRFLGQNPELSTAYLTLGLPSLPASCVCDTPGSPLGDIGACGGFPPFISQGSVLAPRRCPAAGVCWVARRERERKKKISTLLFSSWKIVVICSAFHLLRMGKKCGKIWGNKSQYPRRSSHPSLSLCLTSQPLFSHFFSGSWSHSGFGTGAGPGQF